MSNEQTFIPDLSGLLSSLEATLHKLVTANNPRVIFFIDGNNLHNTLKELKQRTDLHVRSFCEKVCEGQRLIQIRYYDTLPNDARAEGKRKFWDSLGWQGVLVIQGHLKEDTAYGHLEEGYEAIYRGQPVTKATVRYFTEKATDINIATDMLLLAINHAYDIAILVGGDSDFAGVVAKVQIYGKQVICLTSSSRASHATELLSQCNGFIPLTKELVEGCWHRKALDQR